MLNSFPYFPPKSKIKVSVPFCVLKRNGLETTAALCPLAVEQLPLSSVFPEYCTSKQALKTFLSYSSKHLQLVKTGSCLEVG